MRFERNDYKIDSRTAEAGPKTFDRRTGSFCQSRPYRSRRAVGKSRTGNSPGLVGRAMEMIGRAGTLRIKRHFFRPVARFFFAGTEKRCIFTAQSLYKTSITYLPDVCPERAVRDGRVFIVLSGTV